MIKRARSAISLALALLWLAVGSATLCATAAAEGGKPRLALDVLKVETATEYQAPRTAPNVDHLFPTPPDEAIRNWVKTEFEAVGRDRLALLVIREASVVEVPLEKAGGIRSWFTVDQSERYDAVVDVQIEIRGDQGREAYASAQVKRSRTVPEDITEDGRRAVWAEMTDDLLNDLGGQLETAMRRFLADYIR
jgi:hypothetical protein